MLERVAPSPANCTAKLFLKTTDVSLTMSVPYTPTAAVQFVSDAGEPAHTSKSPSVRTFVDVLLLSRAVGNDVEIALPRGQS